MSRIRKNTTTALLGVFTVVHCVVQAQEFTLRPTNEEEINVIVVPNSDSRFSVLHSSGDVNVEITSDGRFRTYQVSIDKTSYVAYADLNGPERHFIFDPVQRRFRTLASSIIIKLRDDAKLADILTTHGLKWGRSYPALDFAIVRSSRDTNPTTLVTQLRMDPRVLTAQVTFTDQFRTKTGRLDHTNFSSSKIDRAPNNKDMLAPRLLIGPSLDFTKITPNFKVSVYNVGATRSVESTLRRDLLVVVPDTTTPSLDDTTIKIISTDTSRVPPLDPKSEPFENTVSYSTEELDAGETYFVLFSVFEGVTPDYETDPLAESQSGFSLDHLKRIRHTCISSGQGLLPIGTDPLQSHQWHLANTGQAAFSAQGGMNGEDLGMADVLSDGPTGTGIKVAVVDTGLELCHPDLQSRVEQGASYNFNAMDVEKADIDHWRININSSDPFNFDPTHGHGSSVAGLIGATANNSIGGRGVAPDVLLRGYNFVNSRQDMHTLIASHGASDFQPDSTDVDVFNMSFGTLGIRPTKVPPHSEQLFLHGIRKLRSGNGVLYVKSAGNSFFDCNSLFRFINQDIGCMSSISDPMHTLPYLIVVGAHNADGVKSSYSSAGANLWVSAPGGEFGLDKPALITVDSMGQDRGFGVLGQAIGVANDLERDATLNPNGDYTSLMNGTSAAAPNVSGAVAVLLEENPEFTWRDVKHILASSARKIDADIEAASLTIGASTRTVRLPWTDNAAGYAFHNWYGFGAVAIDDALEFAQNHEPNSLGTFHESSWYELRQTSDIPDNNVTGLSQVLSVQGLATGMNIEAVVVEIDWQHDFPNDLGVHLISPGGTRSVISQVFNETLAVKELGTFTWRVLTNAFYGEGPQGDWTLEVFDADEDDVGQLFAWRLRIYYGEHP